MLFVLVIAGMFHRIPSSAMKSFPYAFPLCVAYALLGFTGLFYNNLGAEGAGIQLLFLSPTPIRTVLLAKNLLHSILFVLVAFAAGVLSCLRLGVPPFVVLAGTGSWLVFALPCNLVAGIVFSLTMPYRINPGRIMRPAGAQANTLTAALIQLGVLGVGMLKSNRLRFARICPRNINDQKIRVRLNICRRGHSPAPLLKFSIVKVQPSGVILCLSQSNKPRQNDLPWREAIRKRVSTIQLRGQTVSRPDGNAESTVAQRHCLSRFLIRTGEHNARTANDASGIYMKTPVLPCGGCIRKGGLRDSSCTKTGTQEPGQNRFWRNAFQANLRLHYSALRMTRSSVQSAHLCGSCFEFAPGR